MKPSVDALIFPNANTSMPALIAEAKHAEKCANMEYAARNSNHSVVNNSIHHVLILPFLGHFKDKSIAFAFDSQNELASAS
ncbi:hypothetical protein DSO57_1022593 [Entomophthora muscae]|uniref:Uncharacterized protein n=1 Tax=Entomophthora muscae TaxID=34485 RepID=A0ACC2UCL1_9FUNG|nr:hypothetical protein DSO57_1022593 [Entomophthora muscae]